MSSNENLIIKSLNMAKESTDPIVLEKLSHSFNTSIRRAVARNSNTSTECLNRLATDPVLNVSYMATNNPKCVIKRNFSDISNPCVVCEIDERTRNCTNCVTLELYYSS